MRHTMRTYKKKGERKKRILPWSWLRLVFAACLLTRLVRFFRRPWATTFWFLRFLFLANLRGGGSARVRVRVPPASFGGALLAGLAIVPRVLVTLRVCARVALFPFLRFAVLLCNYGASLFLFLVFGFWFFFLFIRLSLLVLVFLFLIFLVAATPVSPPVSVFAGGLLLVFAASTVTAVPALSAPLPLLLSAATATVSAPGSTSVSLSGSGPTSSAPAFPGVTAVFLVAPWPLCAAPPPLSAFLTAVSMGAVAAAAPASLVRRRATTPPLPSGGRGSRGAAGRCWRRRGGRRATAAAAGGGAAAVTIGRGIAATSPWSLLPSARVLDLTTLLFTTGPTPLYHGLRLPLFHFLFVKILYLALIIFPLFSDQPLLHHLFCGEKRRKTEYLTMK